ncbi:MAG: flagellar hook capping FlgD N-terminal domain-containing protein [Planctomycetota bacterium]
MSSIGQATTAEFTAQQQAAQFGSTNDAYADMTTSDFMSLLINELQNQDPLEPMDNAAMVEQIGQIQQIGSTDALTETLTNLNNSQELVTASSLIGQSVTGLSNDGTNTTGVVERVTVETDDENGARSVKVHVGDKTMDVKNIREIQTE